jgi:ABC-type phosphate/phosphonate transport system permease subunit
VLDLGALAEHFDAFVLDAFFVQSTVLGLVGAGGIGLILQGAIFPR